MSCCIPLHWHSAVVSGEILNGSQCMFERFRIIVGLLGHIAVVVVAVNILILCHWPIFWYVRHPNLLALVDKECARKSRHHDCKHLAADVTQLWSLVGTKSRNRSSLIVVFDESCCPSICTISNTLCASNGILQLG